MSVSVEQARKRRVNRATKAGKENHVGEVMEDATNKNAAKKGKFMTKKKADQLSVKLKMKKEKTVNLIQTAATILAEEERS